MGDHITARVSRDLGRRAREAAAAEGMSLSEWARSVIAAAVKPQDEAEES